MRTGVNPGKVAYELDPFKRHRIVMPVYVPHGEGYFRHAVEVLRLALDSLCATTAERASITVISNGCAPAVVDVLRSYFEAGRIDQLLLNDRNWGKIDAILAAVHGRFESLMTVTDADVLFAPGWLDAIEQAFRVFPECGFVTPAPNPSLAYLHTATTILRALMKRELHFEPVVPPLDMDRFAASIGRPDYFHPEHRRTQMVVKRNGTVACVGGGHFVFTVRREVLQQIPHFPTLMAMGSGMTERFDDPPDAMGYWRLSTARAYAWHMGNVPEPWMYEELQRCSGQAEASPESHLDLPPLKRSMAAAVVPHAWRKRSVAALRKFHLHPRWMAQ